MKRKIGKRKICKTYSNKKKRFGKPDEKEDKENIFK